MRPPQSRETRSAGTSPIGLDLLKPRAPALLHDRSSAILRAVSSVDAQVQADSSNGVEGVGRVRDVHIRNYKSIGQATVAMGGLTILVGANGAGKSNFLDALAFVSDSLTDSVELAFKGRGGSRLRAAPFWRPSNAHRNPSCR